MFPLAHAGIPLAAAAVLDIGVRSFSGGTVRGRRLRFDPRLVVLAAWLPDLIDKFVGHVILADWLDNGRTFAHTLMCWAVFTMMAFMASKGLGKRYAPLAPWPLYSLAMLSHLVLDSMWNTPSTLLWPVLGFGFARERFQYMDWFRTLTNDPVVVIMELLGLAALVAFVMLTTARTPKGAIGSLLTGKISWAIGKRL